MLFRSVDAELRRRAGELAGRAVGGGHRGVGGGGEQVAEGLSLGLAHRGYVLESGEITLTAERAFFKSTHVGALFELNSSGQEVTVNILAEDTWSEPIRVTGVGAAARGFIVEITSATFTGTTTVRIQRSVATVGDWSDVSGWTWTADTPPGSLNDGLDNQIIYYRIGVKTGEFTALDDIDYDARYAINIGASLLLYKVIVQAAGPRWPTQPCWLFCSCSPPPRRRPPRPPREQTDCTSRRQRFRRCISD